MSFLPGSLTPALLRSRRHKLHITRFRASTKTRSFRCSSSPQKVINFLGTPVLAKSYPIRTVIQLLDVEKQKEPITQSIRNRREHSSRFKVMFYVIGSEDQSRVLLSSCSRQQNQRRGGAVRYFRSVPMLCRIAPTSLLWVEHFYSVVM